MAIDLGDAPVGTPPTTQQKAQMRSSLGLGTAATTAATAYATAAQGATADSAVQPGDLNPVATSGAYGDLSGTPTVPVWVTLTQSAYDALSPPNAATYYAIVG